jgi:redox-sensitive bicupin YhaK (pirin superfamily)
MMQIRKADQRGHADHGWLDTAHTFSFGDYHDPANMGFRALRVMNEDRVAPGTGFGMHPHREMEILTYVLEGSLQHRDSMGHGSVLGPGELQRISAGTGMLHSEHNPDRGRPVHFYQVWIVPERHGLPPSYEQKRFDRASRHNTLQLVASPDGHDGSLSIRQEARVYLAELSPGAAVTHELAPARHGWLQVVRGRVHVGGQTLAASDGLAVSNESALHVQAEEESEVMVFDLA